jgi:hypothetical protein
VKIEIDYSVLTKDERLTLFLQASSRGDTQEAQAIVAASPRVEVKMIDFHADVHALMVATLLHCLGQANLFTAICHLWEDRDNDRSFLCARMLATDFVVREEAWRSVCEEHGLDYEQLLTGWGAFAFVNNNPSFFDWVKKLALTKTRFEVGPNQILVLEVPTLEEAIEEHRQTIARFSRVLG